MRITLALVRDTFREAMARKIFWGLFGLSALLIAFFLFLLKIDIVEAGVASVSLFGARSDRQVNVEDMVKTVHAGIATFLYTWGVFLSIFASAGLTPSLLEPGRIELLLSKPVSRHHLLLGRYLGNILVAGANFAFLVTGVWLILGAKAGVWSPTFLYSAATALFMFSVLLSVVVLIGVLWDSAALSIMAAAALMIISPILAQTKFADRLLSSEGSRNVWNGLYQVLPKIYDIGAITVDLVKGKAVESWMPVWTSALFGAVMLAAAAAVFRNRDF